jgi:Family of unknown function (DUF5723)
MRAGFKLTLIALAISFSNGFAQVAGTQYFMNSLPQFVNNNPAFMPRYKFALGLPGSMIDVNYSNSGFSYNDLTRKENGKRIADLTRLTSSLPERTYITTTAQVDLFRLGLRVGPSAYLSINSTVRGYGRTMIPRDAISLLVNGNAPYVGQSASISPEIEMTSFWENSAGLAISPIEDLNVGARVKVLRGFVNMNTATANATISVADNYSLTMAADMDVRSSGVKNFGDEDFSLTNYSGNNGLAFDLGATYKLFNKLTLSASILDIGAIKWKNNLTQYTLDKSKANYTFSGVDMNRVVEGDSEYGQALVDSLEVNFKPEEKIGVAYRTALPTKTYLSANYEVMKNFSVGTVLYTEIFQGRVNTGLTIGMNKHFGRVLSTTLSYTMSNRSYNNLGAGLSLNLAPVQIYVVGDNLLRLPMSLIANGNVNEYLNSTQVFNLRLGVNFVWGWMNDDGKKIEDKSYNSRRKSTKATTDKSKHPSAPHVNMRKKKK